MFNINRTSPSLPATADRAIHPEIYTVHKGDTLSAIARQQGVSLAALEAANPDIARHRFIFPGDQIVIPSPFRGNHTVHRGETLTSIARENGTSVAALAKANHISNPNHISVGQHLTISGHKTSGQQAPHPVAPSQTRRAQAPTQTEPVAPAATTSSTKGVLQPGKASLQAADIAERAAGPTSKKQCYAWVKRALQQSGAVSRYLDGVPAKGAGTELVREGFVNVLGKPGYNIRSPYDAPKGAVLVYGAAPGATDGAAKWGHIEIRTSNGFASDYKSANARTGPASNGLQSQPGKVNGRVLIGVYIKPDAGAKLAPAPSIQLAPIPVGKNDIVARLGKVITIGEGNYESYNTGTKGVAGGKVGHSYRHPDAGTVTEKTINQILNTERLSGYNSNRMFATGKYQTTISTLRLAKDALNLTGNERYTPQLQERIFRDFLLQKAGNGKLADFVLNGKGSVDSAQLAAAKEWASIAVPAGYKNKYGIVSDGNLSYYQKTGQNAASATASRELRALLMNVGGGK
jgi:LysM repeat protein